MEVLACSIVVLQAAASVPFVAGLAASVFQELRHWSKEDLYCARACSGTLADTHASYLAMNSSHSATPIFSPLPEVVVFVVVVFVVVVFALLPLLLVAVVVLAVFEVVVFVSEPPHAANRIPKAAHSIRGMKVLFNN
jgi:hypothetical protein